MSLEQDFEILEHLGKEGNSSMLKVKRKKDGYIYFLKSTLLNNIGEDDKKGAINEIKILSTLNHPNIIQFKEAFFDKGSNSINLVLEFPDNGNLINKINYAFKNKMHMEECIIWNVLTQILHGLNYLHKKGIIHRNLISKNIFLNKRKVKITNFAASRKLVKNNTLKEQIGTPFYTAPEIWNEQPYNYKCDIWSVGCIIYELASLSLPFTGDSIDNLYKNIMSKKYNPIPEFYSENLKKIINYMLMSDPSQRPSTDILLNFPNIKENQINSIYLDYKGIEKEKKTSKGRNVRFKSPTENINVSKNFLEFQKNINQDTNKEKDTKLFKKESISIKKQNLENRNKIDKKIRKIENKTYRSLRERDNSQKLFFKNKNIPKSKSTEKLQHYKININKKNLTPNSHKNIEMHSASMAQKDISHFLNEKNKNELKFNNKINQEDIKASHIYGNDEMKNINFVIFNKIKNNEKNQNKYKKFEKSKKEINKSSNFIFNRYDNIININNSLNSSKEFFSFRNDNNKSNTENILYSKNLDLQYENINPKNVLSKRKQYMRQLNKSNNIESTFNKKSIPKFNIDISNFNKNYLGHSEIIRDYSNKLRNSELFNNKSFIDISQESKNPKKNYLAKTQNYLNNSTNKYNNTNKYQLLHYSSIVPMNKNNLLEKIDSYINPKPINFNESQILNNNHKKIIYKSTLFNLIYNNNKTYLGKMSHKYLKKIEGSEDISINNDNEGKNHINKLRLLFKNNTIFQNKDTINFANNNN